MSKTLQGTDQWCPVIYMYEEQPGCHLYYAIHCDTNNPGAFYWADAGHPMPPCGDAKCTLSICPQDLPGCAGGSLRSVVKAEGGIPVESDFPKKGLHGQPGKQVRCTQQERKWASCKLNGEHLFYCSLFRVKVHQEGQPNVSFIMRRGYEIDGKPPHIHQEPELKEIPGFNGRRFTCNWDGDDGTIVMRPPWPGIRT
jgi:hypothetical protein